MLAALILGSVLLASSGIVAIVGMLRSGPWAERLRWLVWPMLALVGFITELAYLRLLPSRLLGWRGADKLTHLVLFGALAFCLDLWLRGRDLHLRRLRVPLAALIVLAGATVEEALQRYSSVRTADLKDLLSDLIGIVVAMSLSRLLLRRARRAPQIAD